MSRTLADVEAYQVYRDGDGRHKWHDGVLVCIRADNGNIYTSDKSRADHIITGPCLGHVRDEPWRKADDDETGKVLVDMANAFADLQRRVAALEQRPVEPVNQCNAPPPAKPTQPPDVAVWEFKNIENGSVKIEYERGNRMFDRIPGGIEATRTVLDAFDRLTWDDLRRWDIGVFGPMGKNQTWDVNHVTTAEPLRRETTEREAITAARAIARKEGWR